MHAVDDMKNDLVDIDDVDKNKTEKLVINDETSQKLIVPKKRAGIAKKKGNEVIQVLNPIPRPSPSFPQ